MASGYAKYSPYSERKTYENGDGSPATPPRTPLNGSTHKLNGAVKTESNGNSIISKSQTCDNVALSHTNGTADSGTVQGINGEVGSPEVKTVDISLSNKNANNHHILANDACAESHDHDVISSDEIDLKIELELPEETMPNGGPSQNETEGSGDVKLTNGHIEDVVDRSALSLNLDNSTVSDQCKTPTKPAAPQVNGVVTNAIQDSPSKKVIFGHCDVGNNEKAYDTLPCCQRL